MKGNRRLLAAVAAVLVAAAALVAVAAAETSDADSSASTSYLSGDLTLDSSMASSSIFVTVVDATNDTTVTIPSDVAYTGTLMFGYHAVVDKSNVDVVFDKIEFNTAISDGKVIYSHADRSITVSAASETPFDVAIATGTVVFGSDSAPADGQVTATDGTVVKFEDAVGVTISVENGRIFLAGVSNGTVDVVSGTVYLREAKIDIGGKITVEKGAVLFTEASVDTTYGFASDVLTSGTVYLKDAEGDSTVAAKIKDGKLQVSGLAENHVYTLVYVAATETADGEDESTGDDAAVTEVSDAAALDAAAAAGGSAKLAADVMMTSTLKIEAGVTFALDLAGHTLTNTADDAISNKGTLTVTDSGSAGKVVAAADGKGAFVNYPGAIAALNGGTYHVDSEKGWYAIKNMGTMTIANGVTVTSNALESGSNSSLVVNGWYGSTANDRGVCEPESADGAARLTIDGGTFTNSSATSTIKNDDWSVTVINGGTFTSNNGYVVQASGTCTINGGTFTGQNAIVTMNGAKGDTTKADPGALTVTGGTFSGAYLAESSVDGSWGYGSLAVSGGTFTLSTGVYDGNEGGIALLTSGSVITGGTYSVPAGVNMGDYLADGTNLVTVDGKTVVGQEYVVVVADGTYHVIGNDHASDKAIAAYGDYAATAITVSGKVTVMGTFGVDATAAESEGSVTYIANTLAVSGDGKIYASAAEDLRVQFVGEVSLLTSGIDAAYYVVKDAGTGPSTVHYTDLGTVIANATGAAGFVGDYAISEDTVVSGVDGVLYTVNPGSTVTVDADKVTFVGDILAISDKTDAQAEGMIDVTSGRLVLRGVPSDADFGKKVSAATRVSSANVGDDTKYDVVYTSLQVAINEAASGQTVAVRDTVASPVVITGEATLAKGVVLDMNGKDLQIGKDGASGTVVFDGTVSNAARLAVVNGSLALNAANTEADGNTTCAYQFTAIDVDDGFTVGAEAEIASAVINVKGGVVAIDGTAAVAVAALDKDATFAVSDKGRLVFATLAATGDGAKLTISATGTVALPAAASSAVDSEISISKLSLAQSATVTNTGTMILAVEVYGASEDITLALASSTEGKTMDATVNGTAYLGAVDINGKLAVNGASTGSTVECAELQIAEGAKLACASLEVSGNVDVAGELASDGAVECGALTVSGTATVQAAVATGDDPADDVDDTGLDAGAVECGALTVSGTMTAASVTAAGITVGESATLTASAVVSTDAVNVAGTLLAETLFAADKGVAVSGTATVQAAAATGDDPADDVDDTGLDAGAVVCGSLTVTGTMIAGDVTCSAFEVSATATSVAVGKVVAAESAKFSAPAAIGGLETEDLTVSSAVESSGVVVVTGDTVVAEGGSFTLASLKTATLENLTVYKGATLKGSDSTITVNGAIVVGKPSADFADNVYSVDVKIDVLGEVATAIIYGTADGLTMPEDAACTTLWLVNGQEDILYNTQYGNVQVALDDLTSAFEGRSGTGWYTARSGGNQIFVKDEVRVGDYSALYQQFDVKTFEILFNYYKGIDGYLVDGQFVQGGTYLAADFGTVYSSITIVAADGYDVSGCTVVPTTLTVTGNASVEVEGAPSVINDDDGNDDNNSGSGSDGGLSLTEYLLIVLVIINAVLAVVVILRLMRS